MNGPPPTPFQAYQAAFYHYPLFEFLPEPLRIPVKGPAPFNMLAVVQTRVWITDYAFADDKLTRRTLEVPTSLTVDGVDPLAPERHPVQHSSTGTIRMMQTTDDTSFVIALDRLHPESRFDARGRWWFSFDVADQFDNVFAGAHAMITSWVLFFDPAAAAHRAATPGPAAQTLSGAAAQAVQALNGYRRYLQLPNADTFAAARELIDLARQLAGKLPSEAAQTQQLAVDTLAIVDPPADQRREHGITLAEARQTLIVRLFDDNRTAEAEPLVAPMLDGYRQFVGDGGDVGRILHEIDDPVKPLLAAHLPDQALAITRAHLDLLEGVTPSSASERTQHLLDLANARHNLVARLIDAARTDEAKALAPNVVGEYRAYAQQPQANLAEALHQLREFKIVVERAPLTEASAAVTAAIVDLSR